MQGLRCVSTAFPDALRSPGGSLRKAVSIVTVTRDTYFFVRLLVEKVREFVGPREYELIVVDRGSRDGSVEWLRRQPDVQLCTVRQWRRARHGHGEAAMHGLRRARHERVVLLDSDAHPVAPHWLEATADRLGGPWRLAGPEFHKRQADGTYTRYVHPHFMAFLKEDLGTLVTLPTTRGHETDTGEEATTHVLGAGHRILWQPMEFWPSFSVGRPDIPTVTAGVFHAWYVTRLSTDDASVERETGGAITRASYLEPVQALLRRTYGLDY